MNKISLLLISTLLTVYSCRKSEKTQIDTQPKIQVVFVGTWERQFEAGPGNPHTSTYRVYNDSIRYTLQGNLGNADYVMIKDTFLLDDNRFIGHTATDKYYLIFVKNLNPDSLTLYKQEVQNVSEGMSIEVPSDTTTSNHGWGIYYKK